MSDKSGEGKFTQRTARFLPWLLVVLPPLLLLIQVMQLLLLLQSLRLLVLLQCCSTFWCCCFTRKFESPLRVKGVVECTKTSLKVGRNKVGNLTVVKSIRQKEGGGNGGAREPTCNDVWNLLETM